ncbi:MAG: MtrB/PioB family decaheme-associated outer membrane protein [Acidobacteria bacterium]|nr:MtrB/PioB family decaheme-associated outer membrane protein [Acidobacteriota bacterium]MBI3655466.1 MtrB/PioB family decaheme-associated outer membrane protein [Acidobacteriota bacterium]
MTKKNIVIVGVSALFMSFFFLPIGSLAQQDDTTISGQISITGRTVTGRRESAKFEEYRTIPGGASSEVLELKYKFKDKYFLDLRSTGIALDDQNINLRTGLYGKFKFELIYDQLPHRFAYDAKTLYSGIGTGSLFISSAIRSNLQDSTSPVDLTNRIANFFTSAFITDLELSRRKKVKFNFDAMAYDPFNLRVEFNRESRKGIRPFFGSFGFGNTVELPEPIDYTTTEPKFIGEYTKGPMYLTASYYASIFHNNIDTLTWSNPYRVTDSTTPTAYTTTYAAGSSRGLIDLYPNNRYHNLMFSGSVKDIPLKSRLSVSSSWGWMRQNDALVPYTTNTAIKPGAANNPPFDASSLASLPERSFDGRVNTALYNVLFTSRPVDIMHVKARYRYYEYDNQAKKVEFPGYVRFDAVWEPEPNESLPTGYSKSTAGVDVGFDIAKPTTFTVGYTFDRTRRKNRENSKQDDHSLKFSLDTKAGSWLDLRASYERSKRDGRYDYRVPHEGQTITPALPFLRKYDEADRNRDRLLFLATLNPVDPLTLSASFIFGKDNFKNSAFGLLADRHNVYSIDADYALAERFSLLAFYTRDDFKNRQKGRQWSPGGIGDPYLVEPRLESFSNWDTNNRDKVDTVGTGLTIGVIQKRLDFNTIYSLSKAAGHIDITSPLGTPATDANPFVPIGFPEVDNTRIHTVNTKLHYTLKKAYAITVGYMREKYDVRDFNNNGFALVPTLPTGAYNGALFMGTLWKNYGVNVAYARVTYNF